MPAPAPIDPKLIRALFRYDPTLGQLTPNPLTPNAVHRTGRYQWAVGAFRYSMHRLIWAYHNPKHPNPYCVQFIDGDRNNARIENLRAIHTNPRWANHVKQVPMRITADGLVIPRDAPDPGPIDRPTLPRPLMLKRQAAQAAAAGQHGRR